MNRKCFITILLLYSLTTIFLNYISITLFLDKPLQIMIPEGTQLYFKVNNEFTWNVFLSQQSWGFDFFSYRFLISIFNHLLQLSTTQLALLERMSIQLLSFIGMYLLSMDYINRVELIKKNNRWITISSFFAGLMYGINPSFIVADSFWLNIEFGFALLPWILWSFNRVILDKKWRSIFLCAILISINIDEHFLWAGFPIILFIYSGFIFIRKTIKEKKINFHSIFSFILVILLFVGFTFYRLISRLVLTSPYQLSLTKAGVDICWMHAKILNMLRAMSHMDFAGIYTTTHPILAFLNSLMYLTLLVPIIVFLAPFFYKRNWSVLFYSLLLITSITPFFIGSPFKWLHYWIFFKTPFGPAFRTWRVPEVYIALSLSILTAFSLYYAFTKVFKKNRTISSLIIGGIVFLLCIYSWPLLTGDVNGKLTPIKVPEEYLRTYSFLSNQTGDPRIIYIPEFTYSYGQESNVKPFWSQKWGAIEEFLTFSSPKPTLLPEGHWSHFYKFTLSNFYYSLLKNGNAETLMKFLKWANIKYIVIHDDIPTITNTVKNYINILNNQSNSKLIFHDNFIYVFENQLITTKVNTLPQITLVDGGYRVVKKFFDISNDIDTLYNFVFIDQKFPIKLLKESKIILTDKSREQLTDDLIFNELLNKHLQTIIYPYDYTIEHNPHNKWSRGSYLDPHQQVWHPYVNWKDYAWDFDYMKGVAFTIDSNDILSIPITIGEDNKYIVMLRMMNSDKGGKVSIFLDENQLYKIKTFGDYNGFIWYKTKFTIKKGDHVIKIKNINGFNAISTIYVISEKKYSENTQYINNNLKGKKIIYLENNFIKNPSFEEKLEGWKLDNIILKETKFNFSFDELHHFNGELSLKLSTDHTKTKYGWSWIKSNWINVSCGEKYYVITHMKCQNVNASHIVVEAYEEKNNRIFQLLQLPSAVYGTFDWRIYKSQVTIPKNVTKLRVVLNAGWSNKNGTNAITWFDDIKLIPIKSSFLSSKINLTLDRVVKLSPTHENKLCKYIEIPEDGIYRFAIAGNGKYRIKIGKYDLKISCNRSNFTYIPLNLTSGEYTLEILPIYKNILSNPSFEREIKNWSKPKNNYTINLDNSSYTDGRFSLRIIKKSTDHDWSWVSQEVEVYPDIMYDFITHMKWKNVKQSHIAISAYNHSTEQWIRLLNLPSGIDGDYEEWKTFKMIKKIPSNITKLKISLNAGWVLNENEGEAITWFDDIEVIPLDEAPKLDTVWLYSTDTNQTIEELFETNETPANITSYEKINPTLWKVEISNATKPFMLSFAESYDPLWEARIYKEGKLVEKVKSIPLYGVINGFWINETGNLSIEIRYTPQDWFEIGLVISGLTFIGCIGYLVYDWQRNNEEKIKHIIMMITRRKTNWNRDISRYTWNIEKNNRKTKKINSKTNRLKKYFRKQWVKIKYREYYKPPPKR